MEKITLKDLQRYANFGLMVRQAVEGFITGLHRSPFHGFSVEFAEHRQYNKGDSTKHIDWKLFARTDKLFTKRYEEETNLRCRLVLDVSSSMYFPLPKEKVSVAQNKLTFSAFSAAALTELMRKQRDAFGLTLISDKISLFSPTKSNIAHQRYLFNELENCMVYDPKVKRPTGNLPALLHQVADMVHRRSLIIIFSDMFSFSATNGDGNQALFSALQHLKHNKHEVVLFHVVDKKLELDFDFQERPYRFVDMETGEMLKLHPNELKKNYTKKMKQFAQQLYLKCRQYGIDFVEADINQGFDQVFWNFLVKRSKLY